MGTTGFFTDERCFWHSGGSYALLLPVGGLVEPQTAGGLPESPESKRRFRNLLEVTGLLEELEVRRARPVTPEEACFAHDPGYIARFQELSASQGGELGLRTPFGPGGFDIAALSAGLTFGALAAVLSGELRNAYALSRPPGHHCTADWPNGFCLLNNIAIAIEMSRKAGLAQRFAVVDWDVHHGNGTEAIFYDRADVLTISVHQNQCYPSDTGAPEDRGEGAGEGYNVNIPLQPGAGHAAYMQVMDQIMVPKLAEFAPDVVLVACGFDASGFDPLARMVATAQTFADMTSRLMELTNGRLVMAHEGGYSEAYVPFCGHAVMQTLSGSAICAQDPLHARLTGYQPNATFEKHHEDWVSELAAFHGLG
jgi:acetoin utilization deacetylase AcuC-like enzyme